MLLAVTPRSVSSERAGMGLAGHGGTHAPRRLGRKELEQLKTLVECGDDLGWRPTPGTRNIELTARSTTPALRPGVPTNRAPASTAVSTCSGRTMVPLQPASFLFAEQPDRFLAASVPKVTSTIGSPPLSVPRRVAPPQRDRNHRHRDYPMAEDVRVLIPTHPLSLPRSIERQSCRGLSRRVRARPVPHSPHAGPIFRWFLARSDRPHSPTSCCQRSFVARDRD